MKSFALAAFSAAALIFSAPALAQDAEADAAPDTIEGGAAWSGEGSLSAGYTTGNTETTDVGAGLKFTRDAHTWRQSGEFVVDYGETDGEETRNRLFGAGQVDRKFANERWSAYGRGSYEQDEFSGFDSRIFIGAGLGYQVFMGDKAFWTIEGGPGYKIDEVQDVTVDGVLTPGGTEESLAFRAGSRYAYHFNENVVFSNDTDVLYADVSTQVENRLALTAKLNGNLSARFSYDVSHETDPPIGAEATDTATRISLVYGFGG